MAPFITEEGLGAPRGWRRTLAYGLAHYGKSLFWTVSELLLAFFLTEVAAIAPEQMGVILAVGFLVSAVADVVVGLFIRRVLRSLKAAGRLQLVGALASSAALLATFASYWLPPDGRAGFALVVGLGFRLGYALYDVPQNTLISLATADDQARTRVVATRYVFTGLASFTVAGLTPWLLVGEAGARALRFCMLAGLFSLVAIGSAVLLAAVLRSAKTAAAPRPVSGQGSSVVIGRPLALLLVLMFLTSLASPIFSKVEPYYAAYVLHAPLLSGGVLAGAALGASLSQPLWVLLGRRLDRQATLTVASAALALAAILFLLASSAGGLAAPICGVVFGVGSGGLGMAIWAAFGDVVARDARGREAMAYALFTAASKLALALGALWIGAFLARYDYRGDNSRLLIVAMAGPAVVVGAVCAAAAGTWALNVARVRRAEGPVTMAG